MKTVLVYVYAGQAYMNNAMRFVSTYHECPPGREHSSVVICNGFQPTSFEQVLFSPLPNLTLMAHDNSGWDIGAFQLASRSIPADLMLFFGSSAYFTGGGWLNRVEDSVARHGFGLYGVHGNAGDARVNVSPHVRTTGFWIAPSLLNKYPFIVKASTNRYEFEHGNTCLANWITKQGMQVWVVTWHREYLRHEWDGIPNGFHRGNQSALLFRDRLCDPPFYA